MQTDTFMLKALLFKTELMNKKYKVLVPQRNEMLIIYCTILGFKQNISKNKEQKLQSNA